MSANIQIYEGNEGKIIARPLMSSINITTGLLEYTGIEELSLLLNLYSDEARENVIIGLNDLPFVEQSPKVYQVIIPGSPIPVKGTRVYGKITETGLYADKVLYTFERTVQERQL